jgi:type IV pilus assembly protein PilZ
MASEERKESLDEPFSGAWQEKRGEERAAITLRVDYKRLNTFFADYAKNISKGGTFIRTSRPLDIGTEFVFVLSIPSRSEQLQLRGEVVWVVPPEGPPEDEAGGDAASEHAGMGIKFKFEGDAERARVDAFVESLMRESLGEHISAKLLSKR